MPTHYEILGISKEATQDEIIQAYKEKKFLLHPDKNKAKDTTEQFQAVNEAFKVLSDPQVRKLYDLEITEKTQGMAFTVLNEGSEGASSTALAIQKSYNFAQVLISANLIEQERIQMAKESEEAALVFIDNDQLTQGWQPQDFIDLALLYEKVALKLLEDENNIFSRFPKETFPILVKSQLVARAFFEISELSEKLSGEQLDSLCKVHGNIFQTRWVIPNSADLMARLAHFRSQQDASLSPSAAAGSSGPAVAVASPSSTPVELVNKKEDKIGVLDAIKITIAYNVLSVADMLQEKYISRIRAYYSAHKSDLMKDALVFSKFSQVVLSDPELRDFLNCYEISQLVEAHGKPVQEVCAQHQAIQTKLNAFNQLLNYPPGASRESIQASLHDAGLTKDNIHLVMGYKTFAEQYLGLFIELPEFQSTKAMIAIFRGHDELTLKILSTPQLLSWVKNYYMTVNNMTINTIAKLRLVLQHPDLINNLSGKDLQEFIMVLGAEASEMIFANSELSQRVLAYQVLAKAQQQGKLHLSEKTTLPLGEEDKADLLYQRGLDYLQNKTTVKTAAEHFRKAAALGHELAFQQLLKLMDGLDAKYYYALGELYRDNTLSFADRNQAELWLLRALERGELKSVNPLLELLEQQISFDRLNGSISENRLFIACSQAIAEYGHQLTERERNTLWRKLFQCCYQAHAFKEAIYISQFISRKDAEEFFALGNIYLDYLADCQSTQIRQAHPEWSDEAIRLELSQDQWLAARLNAAIPYFIHAMNLDVDMPSEVLIKLLSELVATKLVNAEVCSLVLKNKDLARHRDLTPDDLFALCKASPNLLSNPDIAYMAAQRLRVPEQLYHLGWRCAEHLNKVSASAYLFWFRAAHLGHPKAKALVDYLALPIAADEHSIILADFNINLKPEKVLGLEQDEQDGFASPEQFNRIVGTLIHSLNQEQPYVFESTLGHLAAVLNDFSVLAERDLLAIDALDHRQQSPILVLFNLHGAPAVDAWHVYFCKDNSTQNAFYLALLNTRGEVNVGYRALQKHYIFHVNPVHMRNNHHLLLKSLACLVSAQDIQGVDFLMQAVEPTIVIGVINTLLSPFVNQPRAPVFFGQPAQDAMKALLLRYRQSAVNQWENYIQKLLAHLRSYPQQPIFFNDGYFERIELTSQLSRINVNAYQQESNGLVDFQIAMHLTTFVNALIEEKHKKYLARICEFWGTNEPNEPLSMEQVKKMIHDDFRNMVSANVSRASVVPVVTGKIIL